MSKLNPLPSSSYLQECFNYIETTGDLVWRNDRPVSHFSSERAWKWFKSRFSGKIAGRVVDTGNVGVYRKIKVCGGDFYPHRIIWKYKTGSDPSKYIDHKDGNGLNNSWENLRESDSLLNARNRKLGKNNSTGILGVYKDTDGRYRAHISISGKQISLGGFRTLKQATKARQDAEDRQGRNMYRRQIESEL